MRGVAAFIAVLFLCTAWVLSSIDGGVTNVEYEEPYATNFHNYVCHINKQEDNPQCEDFVITSDSELRAFTPDFDGVDLPDSFSESIRHLKSSGKFHIGLSDTPEQIHIGVTEVHGNVSVLWTTSTKSQASKVCWKKTAVDGNFTNCADGTVWTYDPISITKWTGALHGAYMTDLEPGVQYTYRVGDAIKNLWSDDVIFVAPNLEADSVTIAVAGDQGSYQLFGYVVADMMEKADKTTQFDAFWLLGDIAYSTLDPPKYNFEFFWDVYMRQEASVINHVPYLATYGNHDISGGDSGAFINRYRNPQGGKGNGNFYFSYTHGPIFYVSMCTEIGINRAQCDYTPGTTQYNWLVQQFKNVNRTRTPWVVLGGHRPMYSSDKGTDSGPLQKYIEPLLKQYKVDLELSGHMHETEVTAPVINNIPDLKCIQEVGQHSWVVKSPSAPVHITMGNAGALIKEKWVEPAPQWSLYRNGTLLDNAYGFATLRANRTALSLRMHRAHTSDIMWQIEILKP